MTYNYQKTIKLFALFITMAFSQCICARYNTVNREGNPKQLSENTFKKSTTATLQIDSCTQTSNEAQQGSFTTGYTATFTTAGSNVTVTFELLDTDKTGVIAYLWQQTPFGETPMTNTTGLTFTATLSGQTVGTTITYACKFAYAGGLSVTKYINYVVGDTCGGGGPDTVAPTNFTATVGAVTATSVELLVNATDNSGSISYHVSYGTSTASAIGTSGTQKSFIINGLTPSTTYNFSVTATDLTGNQAVNNPIDLQATTLANTNTECAGTSNEVQQGSFSTGYNYHFTTSGTDVTFTFEMLDTDKVGVIAYLWQQTPFGETAMTNTSGLTFTATVAGQTVGLTISYACKFAYAGGLVVTKWFDYTVGNACNLAVSDAELNTSVKVYPNPAKSILNIESDLTPVSKVEFYSVLGTKVFETTVNNNQVNIENLSSGVYMAKLFTENNQFVIKKLIVQ